MLVIGSIVRSISSVSTRDTGPRVSAESKTLYGEIGYGSPIARGAMIVRAEQEMGTTLSL